MGWESRSYGRQSEEGGFRRGLRRIFGENENPLTWSLPLYTAWGIRVRVHLVFILLIISELIWALVRDRLGVQFTAMAMGSLFLLVLLHEYGHCIACRKVGGQADQILMWPLGGLAYCMPPHGWKPDLITTIGGPAVNVILWPVIGAVIAGIIPSAAWGEALLFNPFDPGAAMFEARLADGRQPMWLAAIWWLYYTHAVLLLFNVLVPMYPLDSGRMLQAVLWSRMGHHRATALAVNVGLVVAVILFIVGMSGGSSQLVAVAIFGGLTCWLERRRLAMTWDPAIGSFDADRGYSGAMLQERAAPRQREDRGAERRRKEEERDRAELDRILAKIASSGMGGLTGAEKKWLQRATQKRRQG